MSTRPTMETVAHGLESWDAAIKDNFDKLNAKPAILTYYTSLAALVADADPAAYEGCVAAVKDAGPPAVTTLYVSDGAAWNAVAMRAAAQVDSVAADVPTLKGDFNALLAKLRATGVIGP